MPFYVSAQGIVDRYGESSVVLSSDRNRDQDLDSTALARAIVDAEGEIDSYLATVYTLPLTGVTDIAEPEANTSVPNVLRRIAADVAVYRVAADYGGALTDEKRRRYEDAIAWLKLVAAGTVLLGGTVTPTLTAGFGVSVESNERIFTRTTSRGLL